MNGKCVLPVTSTNSVKTQNNMTTIEKIKAEIERRIDLYSHLSEYTVHPTRIDEDKQLLSFLESLEKEQLQGLDEACGQQKSLAWRKARPSSRNYSWMRIEEYDDGEQVLQWYDYEIPLSELAKLPKEDK